MKTQTAIVAGAVLLGGLVRVVPKPVQQGPGYEYAVKVICGTPLSGQQPFSLRFMTRVNVHNPVDTGYATFTKKVALTVPPGRQRPGRIIKIPVIDTLHADEALTIDCPDLAARKIGTSFEGFLVIHSDRSLDVVAVYTVPGGVDVERATERKM
jgi:hypothetical protein